jgi:hypothetical protein
MIGIPVKYLESISVGAVSMGAKYDIGNGPDFMAKVICDHQKVKLPAHRAGLPGHAVASGMRANEILFYCAP